MQLKTSYLEIGCSGGGGHTGLMGPVHPKGASWRDGDPRRKTEFRRYGTRKK